MSTLCDDQEEHMQLTVTPLPSFPIVQPGDDLVEHVVSSLNDANLNLQDGDILIFTQKIVSKAEGRFVNLSTIVPSREAVKLAGQVEKDPRLVELILRESNHVLRTRRDLIIVEHRLGFICANAGIDRSNVTGVGEGAEDWVILLPKDPDASARFIRERLEALTGARIGVGIIDSHGRAWRMGVVGLTIGLAGIPGVEDFRGKEDLSGYQLQKTEVGVADELAASASLMMGQAAEGTPVVHVRGFPYPLRESTLRELLRPKEMDLFR
jgi:coenzyme F420-0:L-glutamate ligase/coenzyme F420-1:gamma-L-glutamate ligase